ncbi:MAG: helix-turn-helix transcriptional regulator [Burkholderiales bacterium]|nr:helix-turn-helix transcriptional regulator [Burkholderiales bacterium]
MQQILSLSDQLSPLLQAARKSAGLSQTELARRLDLSQSRMSGMEWIRLHPPGPTADHLCRPAIELVVQTKGAPKTNS